MTIETNNPILLWVELVCLSTSWVIIVVVRDPLLGKAVPINHGESLDVVSFTSNVQVVFLSKVNNLIVEISILMLDLVALNEMDPLSSQLSEDLG